MPKTPSRLRPTGFAGPRAYLEARLGDLLRRRPTARPETAPGERVYAVGDIHGRLDLLLCVLRGIEADAAGEPDGQRTRIVLLGDLIDRGPHSRQVLETVRSLEQGDPQRFVVLPGNHEDMLLASLRGEPAAQRLWLRTGGDATLRSYRLDPFAFAASSADARAATLREAVGAEMIAWLEARAPSWQSGDYFFCHAGVKPGVALDKQRREDLLWIRRPFLASERHHGAVVVHGHSETAAAEVTSNRINVDTGAHRSGELTAVGLQGSFRWFLSTARTVLHRRELDEALQWTLRDGRRPNGAQPRRRPRSVAVPDSEAA